MKDSEREREREKGGAEREKVLKKYKGRRGGAKERELKTETRG